MAQVLKVGDRDFSSFIQNAHDAGLDPANSEYSEPQFSGAPAFSEGQAFVGDAVGNRLQGYPLILKAANTDALYQLVRDINGELKKGEQVEYRSGGASQSTFFDLERGRLEITFEYWLDQAARARCVLHLWTRPYGHTGTTRTIASIPIGSSAAVQFSATGVIGDVEALGNIEVRVGSAAATNGRVVMYGVHPHPSFNGIHVPTSGLAQGGATVRGASGAVGSQYTAIPISPTTASGIAYTAYLSPVSAHTGRHRVIGIGRSGLTGPISLYAEDRFGAVLGPTAQASQTDITRWQVIDLGEITVPSRMNGQEPVPTQYINIIAGGASGYAVNASPGFHLNRLIFLPISHSAGIMRVEGVQAGNLMFDGFSRSGLLETVAVSDSQHQWSKVGGYFRDNFGRLTVTDSTEGLVNGATAFYDLASGYQLFDVSAEAFVRLDTGSSVASGAWIEPWLKRDPAAASRGLWTRLTFGPTRMLQMFVGDGTSATNIASAELPTSLATGLVGGKTHKLLLRSTGGAAEVYLATAAALPASPLLSASNAMIALPGNPALRAQRGGAGSADGPVIDQLSVSKVSVDTADVSPREWFRFESYPEQRVIQGNASVFKADRIARFRGDLPRITPVGTGSAQVILFQGEIDNVIGNDGLDGLLSVREQFTYLR